MMIIHTLAYALELFGVVVTCVMAFDAQARTATSLVLLLLVATLPMALILKLRVFVARTMNTNFAQKHSLYYFISLAELCVRTLPVLVFQTYTMRDHNLVILGRYITAMPNICMICAKFTVWRKRRFLVSSEAAKTSSSTIVFELVFALYLAHRVFILLMLAIMNVNCFIMLVVVHAAFGACHSLDELADEPFGEGRVLSPLERKIFNALAVFPVYPVMSVFMYMKILKPEKWWAIFFYVIILSEHVCIILIYFNELTIIASILLALSFVTFACHIIFSNYYADDDFYCSPRGCGAEVALESPNTHRPLKKKIRKLKMKSKLNNSEHLTLTASSWLTNEQINADINFEHLWSARPPKMLELMVPTCEFKGLSQTFRPISCHRFSQAYFKPCLFSQVAERHLPSDLGRIYANYSSADRSLNQVLVHWLESDGSIARHSVSETAPNSSIYLLYFGQVARTLIIEPRADCTSIAERSATKIALKNKSVITMGGTFQQTHTHRVLRLKQRARETDKRCIFVYFRASTTVD